MLGSHPVYKMKLLVTHGYSFYGSSLWDLYGNACNHLYTTWNIAVRRLYELLFVVILCFCMSIGIYVFNYKSE